MSEDDYVKIDEIMEYVHDNKLIGLYEVEKWLETASIDDLVNVHTTIGVMLQRKLVKLAETVNATAIGRIEKGEAVMVVPTKCITCDKPLDRDGFHCTACKKRMNL